MKADLLNKTKNMLLQAFPTGINEEYYWILIYLLYDEMCDENLALVMSQVADRPVEIVANDIYKINQVVLDKKGIQEVEQQLNTFGFEEWKKGD